jgi:hypothetical protein
VGTCVAVVLITYAGFSFFADLIEATLSSSSDGRFADPSLVAQALTAALYGTVPAFCHRVLAPADAIEAERQLAIMFRSYLVSHQSGIAEAKC